jgi:pimeloyl-ACP methyl ester carboxylesterase
MAAGEGAGNSTGRHALKPKRKLLWTLAVLAMIAVGLGIAFYERPVSLLESLMHMQMAMAGMHGHDVTIEGHRMHYDVSGPADGPPVVLVHGLGGEAADWRNLTPFLRAAGYRVYAPDLFGFGGSEWPADYSYSIPDQAASVFAFLDSMGLKQVDLGGLSMGGWVVQRMAADHPERIRKLLIFDSAGLNVKPVWNTALFTPASAVDLDELDALLMPDPPQVPAFVAHDMLRMSRNHAWVMHRALDSMLAGHDTTDSLLPQFKMPVLIVWGDVDHIMPVEQGQKMHALVPQSELEVVQGCGHLAVVQCADRVGPTVQAFLKQ